MKLTLRTSLPVAVLLCVSCQNGNSAAVQNSDAGVATAVGDGNALDSFDLSALGDDPSVIAAIDGAPNPAGVQDSAIPSSQNEISADTQSAGDGTSQEWSGWGLDDAQSSGVQKKIKVTVERRGGGFGLDGGSSTVDVDANVLATGLSNILSLFQAAAQVTAEIDYLLGNFNFTFVEEDDSQSGASTANNFGLDGGPATTPKKKVRVVLKPKNPGQQDAKNNYTAPNVPDADGCSLGFAEYKGYKVPAANARFVWSGGASGSVSLSATPGGAAKALVASCTPVFIKCDANKKPFAQNNFVQIVPVCKNASDAQWISRNQLHGSRPSVCPASSASSVVTKDPCSASGASSVAQSQPAPQAQPQVSKTSSVDTTNVFGMSGQGKYNDDAKRLERAWEGKCVASSGSWVMFSASAGKCAYKGAQGNRGSGICRIQTLSTQANTGYIEILCKTASGGNCQQGMKGGEIFANVPLMKSTVAGVSGQESVVGDIATFKVGNPSDCK